MTTHNHEINTVPELPEHHEQHECESCAPKKEINSASINPSLENNHINKLDKSDLNALKDEIISNLNNRKRPALAWGSLTITLVLGILVLVSVAQASQSFALYNKLKLGNIKSSSLIPSAGAPLQNLPNMVGGC